MKALECAFNQEKALVGAFSVIVQPVVEPMEHYTALVLILHPAIGQQQPRRLSPASEVEVGKLDFGRHGLGMVGLFCSQ